MSEPTGVERLDAFPREVLIERELFRGRANEVDLLVHVGDPTGESQPPLGQGKPYAFWDLRFPCGLVVGLQFDPLTEELLGHLDAPEVEHALDHLGIEIQDLERLEDEDPARFAAVCAPPDRTSELYRLEDDGSRDVIAADLTEREARCRRDQLAAAGTEVFVRQVAPPTPPPQPHAADVEDDDGSGETGAPERSDDAVTAALVARAAGSLGREPEPGAAADQLPASFDPAAAGADLAPADADADAGLSGFEDRDFRTGGLTPRPSPTDQR